MDYSGAGGETDSWKKPEAKNLLTLSLNSKVETFPKVIANTLIIKKQKTLSPKIVWN